MRGLATLPLAPLALLALLAFAACSDEGPSPNRGTLTATLQSPNGKEGAAVLVLFGSGLGEIRRLGDTEVYRRDEDGLTRLVLVNMDGGELSFELDVSDVRLPPVAVVLEVAGPDDELRAGLSSYRIEFQGDA